MKKMKWLGLLIFTLLAACGSVPTDGLTSFMGQNEASTAQNIYIQEIPSGLMEWTTKSCLGEVNLQTNVLRLSYELAGDAVVFEPNNEPLFFFAGGTPLLAHVGANVNDSFRFRCEGEGVLTAVPLQTNGETVGWATGLVVPQLTLELPSGSTKTVDSITLDGFLAPSLADLAKSVAVLYGQQYLGETEKNLLFESHYAIQKALFRNYPDPAFMRQAALNGGISEMNAARLGQLYAGDVANKQSVLLDVITSSDEAYVEAVVGSTISSLYTMGLDTEGIAELFSQETNGRITVKFGEMGAGPWSVNVTNQEDGNVTVHATKESDSEGGSDGGGTGGEAGGETGGEAGGETGGESGGETGGEPGGETGGETGGGTGGDEGGSWPGGRTAGEFFKDLFWNVLGGAAGGAAAGTFLPGVGTLSGALGGALGGIAKTIAGGFWDPGPNDPNNPCSSPFILC